jgi:uncharacterized protein YacL
MYKCRTCGNALAETAISCPHCGDIDPHYNQKIQELGAKSDKQETVSTHIGKIIGVVISFIFGVFVTFNGNHWYDKLLGLAFVIGSILYAFVKFSEYKEDCEIYEQEFSNYRQKREKLKI